MPTLIRRDSVRLAPGTCDKAFFSNTQSPHITTKPQNQLLFSREVGRQLQGREGRHPESFSSQGCHIEGGGSSGPNLAAWRHTLTRPGVCQEVGSTGSEWSGSDGRIVNDLTKPEEEASSGHHRKGGRIPHSGAQASSSSPPAWFDGCPAPVRPGCGPIRNGPAPVR
jgi:hypothetical protein